jgi:rhomboid protease GluP
MANCVRCGKALPPFSVGTTSNRCAECRQLEQNVADSPASNTNAPPWTQSAQRRTAAFQPIATIILIAINVAVFVIMVARGVSLTDPTTLQMVQWGANFGPLTLGAQPWRILTAAFLHIGIIHLLVNMWSLWVLGLPTERLLGRWTFVVVYLISGLSGSIASLWRDPIRISAGASGAIFGLLGALIAVMYLGKLPLPKEVINRNLKNLLFVAGLNLLYGMSSHIDNSAHVGGLVAGLAFGAMVAPTLTQNQEDRTRLRFLAGMAMVLVLAGTMLYVRHANHHVVDQFFSSQPDR